MVEEDYITRMINEIIRTLLKLIFKIELGKDNLLHSGQLSMSQEYDRLIKQIDEGNINETENELTDMLSQNSLECFQLGLAVYLHLNKKSDDFLENHNYSRDEITDGLRYLSNLYGYRELTDSFLRI